MKGKVDSNMPLVITSSGCKRKKVLFVPNGSLSDSYLSLGPFHKAPATKRGKTTRCCHADEEKGTGAE